MLLHKSTVCVCVCKAEKSSLKKSATGTKKVKYRCYISKINIFTTYQIFVLRFPNICPVVISLIVLRIDFDCRFVFNDCFFIFAYILQMSSPVVTDFSIIGISIHSRSKKKFFYVNDNTI